MLATSQLHLLLELADNSQAYIKHQTFFEVLVITTRTISYRILRTCHSGSAPPRKKDQKSRPKQAYFPCVSMWFHVFSSFFPPESKACEANRQWRFPKEPATSQAEWSTNKFRSRCSTLAPVQAANTAESVVEYAEARASGLQVQMSSESIDNLDLPPCFLLVEGSLS